MLHSPRFPKITTRSLLVCVPWTIKLSKKNSKIARRRFCPIKFSKSTPGHIRTARSSRRRPLNTIEVEYENVVKKLIDCACSRRISTLRVIFNDFRPIAHSIGVQECGNTVFCRAMARGQSTTAWRIGSLGVTTGARIFRFCSDASKNGLVSSALLSSLLGPHASTKLPRPNYRLGRLGLAIFLNKCKKNLRV